MRLTTARLWTALAALALSTSCSGDPAPEPTTPEPTAPVLVEQGPDYTTCPTDATQIEPNVEITKQSTTTASQQAADWDSWNTFIYLNSMDTTNHYNWESWSGAADFLNEAKKWSDAGGTGDFPAFGAVYMPDACTAYCDTQEDPATCKKHRPLEQVGKVNDAVFEANTTGLSTDPVIAANGTFLRFEILINQDMYDFAHQNKLYEASNVYADNVNATCGGAAAANNTTSTGAMNLKLAWMSMEGGIDQKKYLTRDRLVFTSGAQRSDGQDHCELVTMGLVGMHIAHKTLDQQGWTWATFEHNNNAPYCGDTYKGGTNDGKTWDQLEGAVNTVCDTDHYAPLVGADYNFWPVDCKTKGNTECQTCNAVPAMNDTNSDCTTAKYDQCATTYKGDNAKITSCEDAVMAACTCAQGYCVDQDPATTAGRSRLCRQVATSTYGSDKINSTCATALGKTTDNTVLANYELISTQWSDNSSGTTCQQSSADIYSVSKQAPNAPAARQHIFPQVAGTTSESLYTDPTDPSKSITTTDRPVLGNTSMESYERSSCLACHAKGAMTNGVTNQGAPGKAGQLPSQAYPDTACGIVPNPVNADLGFTSTVAKGTKICTEGCTSASTTTNCTTLTETTADSTPVFYYYNTPTNEYYYTDYSWWMALEVPNDGL